MIGRAAIANLNRVPYRVRLQILSKIKMCRIVHSLIAKNTVVNLKIFRAFLNWTEF